MQLVPVSNGVTITSRELAELSGRRHDNILRSIESLNKDLSEMNKPQAEEFEGTAVSEGINSGRTVRQFTLNKYQCELLAMALDGKARIKVLDRLKELEATLIKPKTFEEQMRDMLLLADARIEEMKQENLLLEAKIEEDKPLTHYAQTVLGSYNPCSIREYVNSLKSDNGLQVGEKQVIKFLLAEKYIYRDGARQLRAYSAYSTAKKFFTLVPIVVNSSKGALEKFQLKVTPEGQVALEGPILSRFNGLIGRLV